jgi:hypothetical protein
LDLLTTLLVCNLHGSDPALVRAITANSHENRYFVADPAADYTELDVPPEPKTEADALARVRDIASHGGKPLLGLLQLPLSWLTFFGRDPAEAFDPCVNIAIGSAMLSAFDADCAKPSKRHDVKTSRRPAVAILPRRLCVIRKYAEAMGESDFEEVVALELQSPSPTSAVAEPTDAPIFASPPARAWGPDCLLVPLLPVADDAGVVAHAAPLSETVPPRTP